MTNQKVLDYAAAFEKVGNLTGQKFTYAIARNNNILRPFLEKYSEDRKALLESFANKDEAGKPILKPSIDEFGRPTQKYDITDMAPYNMELEKLVKEDVGEVKLYRIAQKELPANISADALTGIIELVDETNEPSGK